MPLVELNRPINNWAQVLDPKYRYIFIKGGRTSSKSHEVAGYLSERSFTEKNLRIVCLREVQKSIKRSSKQLIQDKLTDYKLIKYYKPIETEIRKTIEGDDGIFLFQGMNDLTADNVKSLEKFKVSWFEEAQNASFTSLKTLRPTIARVDGSQQIYTWNPKLPTDPIDELSKYMQNEDDVLVLHINYEQNHFLSDSAKREIDMEKNSPDFNHIYLGGYDESFQGHYYAKHIQQALDEERITNVPRKSGVDIVCAFDLGMRDATAIWVAQRVGLEWRVIDYYENNFEELEHYVDWLKDNNYHKGKVYLPHDGAHNRIGMKGSIKDQMKTMGVNNLSVLKVASVDSGMATAKTFLMECYIDKDKCKEGIAALSHYHAKYDENKKTFKEVHDWSSHGSDAFRYLAQATQAPHKKAVKKKDTYTPRRSGWMG